MTKIIYIVLIAAMLQMVATRSKKLSRSSFATKIFNEITKINPTKNIIISPLSIQTCLAMGYLGANGKTAKEISTGLHLTNNRKEVAAKFEKLTNSAKRLVKIANKLYANKLYEIKPEFNNIAIKAFNSKAETLDFSKPTESVKIINDWVATNTNNKIENLLSPTSVDSESKMILVNAIYFKGAWAMPFSTYETHKSDFWTSKTNKISVSMMSNSDTYKYGIFPALDATAIEMPYKNSTLSMMIILPNARTGLNHLLSKIKNTDVLELANKMKNHYLKLNIPKFKIEFDITLNNVLKSMGMNTMFSDAADFSNLFKTNITVKVSDVIHKAFIDVNEAGSEVAVVTFMKMTYRTIRRMYNKIFTADHPFIYLIKDKTSVYFVGQLIKF